LSWEAIRAIFEIAIFFISGGASVYVYLTRRNESAAKRTGHRLDDHQGRITKLEGAIGFAPTHDDVTGLKTAVARLEAETTGQTELLKGLTRQVDRINQWLIDRAK
jgi:hypothetical protein